MLERTIKGLNVLTIFLSTKEMRDLEWLEAVLEFLRTAMVPIVITLVTVWLVHRYETKRLRIEQDENIVRQLFDRYVNALVETYQAMSECFDTLNRFANSPPKSEEDFEKEVWRVREKWDMTEQKNALWLTKINNEISVVRGEFKLITQAIFDAIGKLGTSFNRWEEFNEAYSSAAKALRGLIPISSLEEKLKKTQGQANVNMYFLSLCFFLLPWWLRRFSISASAFSSLISYVILLRAMHIRLTCQGYTCKRLA